MEPADSESAARIAEIMAGGRATRRRSSRAMWLAAMLVGAVCALGFALLLVSGGDAGGPAAGSGAPAALPPTARESRTGCAGGLGLGLGLGLAVGYALGRRHSSRSSP